MKIYRVRDAKATEMFPGCHGRFLHGNNITIAIWEIESGCDIPSHSHHHEQFINCLEGQFEVEVGSMTYVLSGGDSVYIPPNVVHSARSLTRVKCIDVFNPKRDDYVL
jgi:quercetin dioxygenase-like cupin family protein